jgi:triosephosphate isomerase (TIM)
MITVINFKTYKTGKDALKLAKTIEKFNKNIIIGVQPSHLNEIATKTKLKVYSQHVDQFKPGRRTGYIIPEAIKKDGAKGTFLNHSEHKIPFRILKKTIKVCKETKLKTIVFASNLKEAKRIQKLKPDLLIIEPPELVATKTSVSKEKPELIINISKKLKTKFLVGAGIHTKEDVKIALKLGASGVALSSAITKSKNPKKVLKDLF